MTSIALFVTGKCERLALHAALRRVFPRGHFYVDTADVHPFTSKALRPPFVETERAQQALEDMLGALVARNRADYAILIDDLELANTHCGHHVLEYFRTAATAFAGGLRTHRLARLLRERCSVHLLVPMLEAYFFGDPSALSAAGAPAPSSAADLAGLLEEFRTRDPAYLGAPNGSEEWATEFRCAHPKHYLRYLVESRSSARFREGKQGVAALRALDLRRALRAGSETDYMTALLDDVACMLGVPSPTEGASGASTARAGQYLRNV